MSVLPTIHIVPDGSRNGGGRADASLKVPSNTRALFQGFDLSDLTAYAVVTDLDGRNLSDASAIELYGAGDTGMATLDCDSEQLRSWTEDSASDMLRIAMFTEADGWLVFAELRVVRMPEIPEIPS